MGIVGKVIKNATKNDVKLAKLKIKKKKLDIKNQKLELKNQRMAGMNAGYSTSALSFDIKRINQLTYDNIDDIKSKIESLVRVFEYSKQTLGTKTSLIEETRKVIKDEFSPLSKFSGYADNRASMFQTNNDRKSTLDYLYLSKDYFDFLCQYLTGIQLTKQQQELIKAVSSYYFYDKPIELSTKAAADDDYSLMGMVKEVGQMYKETIVPPSSTVNFIEHLHNAHGQELTKLEIPDIDSSIDKFIKLFTSTSSNSKQYDSNSSTCVVATCSTCGASLYAGSKFCSQCGNRITISDKVSFCSQCGSKVLPGSRFCSSCGEKI